MQYTNDKIKKLIADRDAAIQKFNYEIHREIEKEKAKYYFDWKRFMLMIACAVFMVLAIKVNKKIFPKTSIWSWEYYTGEAR